MTSQSAQWRPDCLLGWGLTVIALCSFMGNIREGERENLTCSICPCILQSWSGTPSVPTLGLAASEPRLLALQTPPQDFPLCGEGGTPGMEKAKKTLGVISHLGLYLRRVSGGGTDVITDIQRHTHGFTHQSSEGC